MMPFAAVFGAEVTAERSERGVVVKIDGEMFTEYLTEAGESPALWPIVGPTGKHMTRAWPLGPKAEDARPIILITSRCGSRTTR